MKERFKSGVAFTFVAATLVAVFVYALARIFYITQVHFEPFERVFSTMFLAAELFVLLHAAGFFIDVVTEHFRNDDPPTAEPGPDASVAIIIPARHEPKRVIESTLLTCLNLDYPNKSIYLLDDSSIASYKQEARDLAAEHGVKLFTRNDNRGAKAGLINDVLKELDEKYVAIFDADQNPMPMFLDNVLQYLEGDRQLAFVQTPQFYSNTESSRVAKISHAQQAVFFEYVCNGKSSREAMFCCGTNVVFRRSALEDIGGFDEGSVTEDLATSLKLHLRNWRSLYHNKAYTFGMAPEDLGAYITQQNRWAMGSIQLFRKLAVQFFTNFRALRLRQWFEYFLTSTYYFIGWAYLLLLLGPILYIFLGIPWFFMDPGVYVLTYMPYITLSLLLFYSSMKSRQYSNLDMFKSQMLTMITIPVYIRAATLGLLNIRKGFQVTPKEGSRELPYIMLLPQLLLWGLHISALTWGLLRLYYEQSPAIAMNVLWVSLHSVLFSSVFYFNTK